MIGDFGTDRPEAQGTLAERTAPACPPMTPGMRAAAGAVAVTLIFLMVGGMFAAFGLLPGNADAPVLAFWWWYGGIVTPLMMAATLARAAIPREERRLSCRRDPALPRLQRVVRYLSRGLVLVLLAGGEYGLAGLIAFLIVLAIARDVEDRRIRGEIDKVDPLRRALHGAVFAVGEAVAPATRAIGRLLGWKVREVPVFGLVAAVALLPLALAVAILAIPFWLYGVLRHGTEAGRRERELVKAAHAGGSLAWFAYAEAHQREHFLGPGGVLHDFADRVILRDWRQDLQARAHGVDSADADDLDAVLLRRLNMTSMRADLPVLVILLADGRTSLFRLNRAYRGRRRDGGDLLAKLEEGMRLQLRQAALPA